MIRDKIVRFTDSKPIPSRRDREFHDDDDKQFFYQSSCYDMFSKIKITQKLMYNWKCLKIYLCEYFM